MSDVEETGFAGMPLTAQLSKLSLKRGDIVLLRGDDEDVRIAMRALKAMGPDHERYAELGPIPLLVLGDATLETADEQRMNAAGWFRK